MHGVFPKAGTGCGGMPSLGAPASLPAWQTLSDDPIRNPGSRPAAAPKSGGMRRSPNASRRRMRVLPSRSAWSARHPRAFRGFPGDQIDFVPPRLDDHRNDSSSHSEVGQASCRGETFPTSSERAGRTLCARLPYDGRLPTWKSATQQAWKPALRARACARRWLTTGSGAGS